MSKYDIVSDGEIESLIIKIAATDTYEEDLEFTDREQLIITRALEEFKKTNG